MKKVVLITGGSKGIGREIARIYHSRGYIIYIFARNKERILQTVTELDPLQTTVFGISADIAKKEDCEQVIRTIIAEQGRLDILLNNAGMAMRGSIEDTSFSVMQAMVEINLLGPAYLSHLAIPYLKETHGSIHFTSTLAGLRGLPKVGLYSASKGALTLLSESLRAEVASQQVHVGITYVGFTENDADKVVYAADGSLTTLAPRKKSQTQQETATAIVRAVDRRKSIVVLTGIGKLASFAYRYFPRLTGFLIGKFASKSSQYAQQ